MIVGDPNLTSVELVAAALGELCEEVVLVGGCAASLLIDAPLAPPPRVTTDVDLIAAVREECCLQIGVVLPAPSARSARPNCLDKT